MADKPVRMITSRIFNISGKPVASAESVLAKIASAKSATVKTASALETGTSASDRRLSKLANLSNIPEEKRAKPFGAKDGDDKEDKEPVDENAEPTVEASASTSEVKVAEGKEEGVEKYEAGKKEATEFTNDADKKPEDSESPEKNSGVAATTTTKTQDGTFPSSGQTQWEGRPENNNKPEMPTDKNTQASASEILKLKLARLDGKYVMLGKFANLKSEVEKEFLDYWKLEYDEEYAKALCAKK